MYVICKNMRNTQNSRYNIRRDVIYKIARGIVIAKFELYEYLCSSPCIKLVSVCGSIIIDR